MLSTYIFLNPIVVECEGCWKVIVVNMNCWIHGCLFQVAVSILQSRRASFPRTWRRSNNNTIFRCSCHFPFIFTLQRIFRRLQVIILPTPENVKCHTTTYQKPISDRPCDSDRQKCLPSGFELHWQSGLHFCCSEWLKTVENTVFRSWCCGVWPKPFLNSKRYVQARLKLGSSLAPSLVFPGTAWLYPPASLSPSPHFPSL